MFIPSIMEFCKALGKRNTYNIRKNTYSIFGVLWGIPVPIVTTGIALYYRDLSPTLPNIINEVVSNPLHFFFLMHPFIFGIVFGAMGTVREEKEEQKLRFEKSLIEINEKLKTTNKKLQELDELKDNFLSMVSHELWSPLTTIQGHITFLKDGKSGTLDVAQKEVLEIVEEQTVRLDNLIRGLVDISKIETGKFDVALESMDIKNVVYKTLDSMKQQADEKNILLKNEVPQNMSKVLADKERIVQVLVNLLGNAIKFTPKNKTVTLHAKEKDETVEFAVTDEGIGIPEEKIDKIFDKFYQVDSTSNREFGGCGLGLAIARSIIELHNGQIWVKSQPGAGSKFMFELRKSNAN